MPPATRVPTPPRTSTTSKRFTKTNWNERAYDRHEHIGTVRRINDETWRADADTLGPIPSPWQGAGYDFPSHCNALVNLLNRTKPELPATMLPRSGLPLHPRHLSRACRCPRNCNGPCPCRRQIARERAAAV